MLNSRGGQFSCFRTSLRHSANENASSECWRLLLKHVGMESKADLDFHEVDFHDFKHVGATRQRPHQAQRP